MDRASLIFCSSSLLVCALVAAIFYPYAALTSAQLDEAKNIATPEQIGALDLGDFGNVEVTELVDYYIENPPEPVAAGTAVKRVRFEGC